MYVFRLPFHVLPGHTSEMEQRLDALKSMIERAGARPCRILRRRFGSGGPDLVLEQDVDDLASLEQQIKAVANSQEFLDWSRETSRLLEPSPAPIPAKNAKRRKQRRQIFTP